MAEDFDEVAEGFDTNRRRKRAQAVAQALRGNLGRHFGTSAIEFGCGTGLVGFALTDCFSALTFIDSSAGMIAQAQKKITRLPGCSLATICCDPLKALPDTLRADCVFSSLVLHHIVDTERAFVLLRALLHPGGKLMIVDLDAEDGSFHAMFPNFEGHNGFLQPTLAALASQAGFEEIHTETFYRDEKLVNGEKKPYSLFILTAERA